MKNVKRILSVKVLTMIDDSPDTSYLGEYSQLKSSDEFSIDRKHTEECNINNQPKEALAQLDRVMNYLFQQRREVSTNENPNYRYDSVDEALDIVDAAKDELQECNCDESGEWTNREYEFFNPSFNYVGSDGKIQDNLTPEEVRKYTRQDYERMEAGNRGDWNMLGIRAEARVQLTKDGPWQEISSGGLWGIESDSDQSYIKEVKDEQLHELREQLKALGFASRAISKAFQSAEDKDE
jgi:hypothetical protein